MVIERTDKEIIFRLPVDTDIRGLQRVVNYFKYKNGIKTSAATEEQANELANESKKRWWAENKQLFIK